MQHSTATFKEDLKQVKCFSK